MWPQITMICFFVVGTTVTLVKNGEPKGEYDIWWFSVAAIAELWILNAGGFFDVLKG